MKRLLLASVSIQAMAIARPMSVEELLAIFGLLAPALGVRPR